MKVVRVLRATLKHVVRLDDWSSNRISHRHVLACACECGVQETRKFLWRFKLEHRGEVGNYGDSRTKTGRNHLTPMKYYHHLTHICNEVVFTCRRSSNARLTSSGVGLVRSVAPPADL